MGADSHLELIVEQQGGSFCSATFDGVPAARAATIAIACAPSTMARTRTGELVGELEAVLRGAVPGVVFSGWSPCPTPAGFDVRRDRHRVKLLVLVTGGDAPFTKEAWHDQWWDDAFSATAMILLPPGDYASNFDATIAPNDLLRRINALTWRKRIDEALPAILSRAEITSLESRIFISYRRVETLSMALQLFDRLVKEGFEVFLDRFSIPPGFDFQRRLNQALCDKSMVLLLESKGLRESEWTQHEIDFAKRHRLGLYALRLPNVLDEDRLAAVFPDQRKALEDEDFVGPSIERVISSEGEEPQMVEEWPEMKDEALDEVVTEIKVAHAAALFRRRHRLRADIVAALTQEKDVGAIYSPIGSIEVTVGGERHLLWPVTRPPAVSDFQTLHGAHRAGFAHVANSRAIIVGPRAALEPDRHEQLVWLSDVSACLCYDEGDLAGFARRVAQGTWV